MRESAEDIVLRLLARSCMVEEQEVPPDASIANFSAWSSLAHMRFVLALEEHLKKELSAEDILNMTSLTEACSYLNSQHD